MVHLRLGPSVLCPDCLLPSAPYGRTGTGLFGREPSNSTGGTFTHERRHLHELLQPVRKLRGVLFSGKGPDGDPPSQIRFGGMQARGGSIPSGVCDRRATKPAGPFRENPPGGGSFAGGPRWLDRHSPLRGCSGLAALATAKIPRRRTPLSFQTGSQGGTLPNTGMIQIIT